MWTRARPSLRYGIQTIRRRSRTRLVAVATTTAIVTRKKYVCGPAQPLSYEQYIFDVTNSLLGS